MRAGGDLISEEENVNASERASYAPSWYTATMVPTAMRGPLTFDLDVDVCVIGGGLAGLTTAREIARRGWSVVVLETDRIAANASGRNDGFVLPGFAESMERVVSRVGMEHAKALWDLSEMGLRYVRTTIAEARMPGVAPIAGWLKVSKVDNGDEVLADVQLYGQELGAEVEGWPTERVREVLKTNHYFHALHLPRAFHIHPLNYALGLASVAEAAGARIFEATPALAIDAEGVRKRITTPSARVRAGHIVVAGNVHLGALMPRVVGTLMPIWSYAVTTAPLGPRLAEAVTYRGAVTRYRSGQQPLPHRRQRPADVVGTLDHMGGESGPDSAAPAKGYRGNLSAARRGRDRACLVGRAGHSAAPDAADRGAVARRLACERLRRPWSQHDSHGRQHRRRRRSSTVTTAGDCSRPSSWSGRAASSAAPRCRSTTGGSTRANGSPRVRRASARRNTGAGRSSRLCARGKSRRTSRRGSEPWCRAGRFPKSRPWPNSPPTPSPPARSPLRRWSPATPDIEPAVARGFARPDAPRLPCSTTIEQQDWPPADGAGRRRR